MSHPGGRPLKFQSPEELQAKIDEYFAGEGKDHPTVTGLALHLDTTRKTLTDYDDRDEFSNTIKRAKARVEAKLELALYGNSVTGLIFNLKNNFGWKDKSEVEHSGGNPVRILLEKYGLTEELDSGREDDEPVSDSSEGASQD